MFGSLRLYVIKQRTICSYEDGIENEIFINDHLIDGSGGSYVHK